MSPTTRSAGQPAALAKANVKPRAANGVAKPVKQAAVKPRKALATVTAVKQIASPRALDVSEIVEVALRMGIEEGFEALSMRPLARELGVSPMAIYHHVGNKEDLLARILDAVLEGIVVPPAESGTWDERLRLLNDRSHSVMTSCRGIEIVIFGMRPTRQVWRLINAYLEILLDAGLDERDAALAFSTIHSYGLGRAGMEGRLRGRHDRDESPQDLPALVRLQPYWSNLHRPDHRDFAFEVIISGIKLVLLSEKYTGTAKAGTAKANTAKANTAKAKAVKARVAPARVLPSAAPAKRARKTPR